MIRLLVIVSLFLCAVGLRSSSSIRFDVGRKLLLSKLTMAGGSISDADKSKPTIVYFDAR